MNNSRNLTLTDEEQSILNIEPLLVELDANRDKFITCYNEMYWIIICAKGIQKYLDLQSQTGLTDTEFFTILSTIFNNLQSMGIVSDNINSIIDLVNKLNQNPSLLEETQSALDTIYATFYANANDTKQEMLDEINKKTLEAKEEILRLLNLLLKNGLSGSVSIEGISEEQVNTLIDTLRTELNTLITDNTNLINSTKEELLAKITELQTLLDNLQTQLSTIQSSIKTYKAGDNITFTEESDGIKISANVTAITTTEKTYEKYIVVANLGQSNSVGFGSQSIDDRINAVNMQPNRIMQLGFFEDNLQVIPLTRAAQNLQGKYKSDNTFGYHLPLANILVNHIPDDYGLLFVNFAVGDSNFTSGRALNSTGGYDATAMTPTGTQPSDFDGTNRLSWGATSDYYYSARDRIKYALQLNDENIFGGLIWLQGESDYQNAADAKTKFEEMYNLFFEEMNADADIKKRVLKGEWDRDIWFFCETVAGWYGTNYNYNKDASAVWENYKKLSPRTYIKIPREAPVNGTDYGHFGSDAHYDVVAPCIAEKLLSSGYLPFANNKYTGQTMVNPEYILDDSIIMTDDYDTNITTLSTNSSGDLVSTSKVATTEETKYTTENDCRVLFKTSIYGISFIASRNRYNLIVGTDLEDGSTGNGKHSIISFCNLDINGKYKTFISNNNSLEDIVQSESPTINYKLGDRITIRYTSDTSLDIFVNDQYTNSFLFSLAADMSVKRLGFSFAISGDETTNIVDGLLKIVKNLRVFKEATVTNTETIDTEALKQEIYTETDSRYIPITDKETTLSGTTNKIADSNAVKTYVDEQITTNISNIQSGSNIYKVEVTIDSIVVNTDKEVEFDLPAGVDDTFTCIVSFSNDTNEIALESGVVMKALNPGSTDVKRKAIFTTQKDATNIVVNLVFV